MTNIKHEKTVIGFIGQGWIGRNLADNFEERGYPTVRFAKEVPYNANLEALHDAEIIFVAVPTPTTPEGFDDRILRSAIDNAVAGQTVVIKSTILPGTTDAIAALRPDLFVFHSPEFLRETSVKKDIAEPERNIIGIPSAHQDDAEWNEKAQLVLSVLAPAPYNNICSAVEAELTKYGGNNFLYMKVVFMNTLYDLAQHHGASWDTIAKNMIADSRIGASHMQPVHQHTHMGKNVGRGAGGHCFIKDFSALRGQYEMLLPEDKETIALLRAFEAKNNSLLMGTQKDQDLLVAVYGDNMLCVCKISDKGNVCVCKEDK